MVVSAAGADAQMEHAGFLMALGLNGHLKNLLVCQMSTFDYLSNSKTHEMISVGILLGSFGVIGVVVCG